MGRAEGGGGGVKNDSSYLPSSFPAKKYCARFLKMFSIKKLTSAAVPTEDGRCVFHDLLEKNPIWEDFFRCPFPRSSPVRSFNHPRGRGKSCSACQRRQEATGNMRQHSTTFVTTFLKYSCVFCHTQIGAKRPKKCISTLGRKGSFDKVDACMTGLVECHARVERKGMWRSLVFSSPSPR